jgi:hypothetical protein
MVVERSTRKACLGGLLESIEDGRRLMMMEFCMYRIVLSEGCITVRTSISWKNNASVNLPLTG